MKTSFISVSEPLWTTERDIMLINGRRLRGLDFEKIASYISERSMTFKPQAFEVEERWDILMGDPWGDQGEIRQDVEANAIPTYDEDVANGDFEPPGSDDEDNY